MPDHSDLIPVARRVVEEALGVKPGERVLIVTDFDRPPSITKALLDCARRTGAEVVVTAMAPRDHGGIDPPSAVGAAITASHAVVMQTSFAHIHTKTLRGAMAQGVRICEFWGVTEEMMTRGGLTEDLVWLEETSRRLAEKMSAAGRARLTTPEGTDLSLDLSGRKAIAVASTARTPGTFCSLPAGEAAMAPLEGTATGKVIQPYLVEHRDIDRPREPLELHIREGSLMEIRGGREATRLEKLVSRGGPSARNLAEFAIGTNRRCRLDIGIREAKKAWGTAHVAIGDNRSIGGVVESSLHIDFILTRPTVWLDGQEVVREGKLLVQ